MKSNREKIGWAIVIVVFIGLLAPVVMSEPRHVDGSSGGGTWRNIIYDFQTLITGFFAVGAAFVTVRQMERLDRESERRFRKQVDLQLRPDRLRLRRALFPQIFELQELKFKFHDIENIPKGKRGPVPAGWAWLTDIGERYLEDFEELDEVLNRRQFNEGVSLFDGRTTRYLDELIGASGTVVVALRRQMEMEEERAPDSEYLSYLEEFPSRIPQIESDIAKTMRLLPKLIESLETTERVYEEEF